MFQKVLVAEDLGSIGFSLVEMLSQMGVAQVDHVLYCDDAYQKLMYAQQNGKPYDLFISDLSFGPDFKSEDIQNGMHLIKRIREQMEVKTIVYSIDNNLQKVRMLVDKYEIDAYVSKGRKGPEELKKAIRMVEEDDVYYSKDVLSAFIDHKDRDINDYDIKLLQLMSEGNTKQEIRNHSTLSTHSYRLQAIIQTSSRNGKQRTTNRKQKTLNKAVDSSQSPTGKALPTQST